MKKMMIALVLMAAGVSQISLACTRDGCTHGDKPEKQTREKREPKERREPRASRESKEKNTERRR